MPSRGLGMLLQSFEKSFAERRQERRPLAPPRWIDSPVGTASEGVARLRQRYVREPRYGGLIKATRRSCPRARSRAHGYDPNRYDDCA